MNRHQDVNFDACVYIRTKIRNHSFGVLVAPGGSMYGLDVRPLTIKKVDYVHYVRSPSYRILYCS